MIARRRKRVGERTGAEPESSYDMANLYPRNTGLTHTVYLSPRNARHDVRVKVCKVAGDRMIAEETVSVAVRPQPRIIGNDTLPADVWNEVVAWIRLNQEPIVDFWDGRIDTIELSKRLHRLHGGG
jgi:hypothetical protein